MPPVTDDALPSRLVRWARRRARQDGDEGGFILLETMIALTLITVIMTAVSAEYVNAMVVSGYQRAAASAAHEASTAMSGIRGTDPSNLLGGRSQTEVSDQRARLVRIAKVAQWVGGASAYQGSAPANTPTDDVVSTVTTTKTTASGQQLRVETYLECVGGSSTNASCTNDGNKLRAVVAVLWSGRGCPKVGSDTTGTCAFVSSTLIDVHANPTFDLNQPLPPAPTVLKPCDQEVAIGETLPSTGDSPDAVRMQVQDGKGAAPFTWSGPKSGRLPTGLTMAPDGLITGTVAEASPGTLKPTLAVTDAFLREESAQCTWTVLARLAIAQVADQASFVNQPITPVKLTASGGTAPYAFSDPNATLPAGLTLATDGTVTGTPTTPTPSPLTVRPVLTDKSGRTATTSFTWTVSVPPLAVTNPGNQTTTANRPFSATISVSGGSGSYAFTAPTKPSWLTISPSGVLSGTPATTTSTPASVQVTVRDTQSNETKTVEFTINVVLAPTVTSPGNQTTTRTGAVDLPVQFTCPNGPCTFSMTGQPAGLDVTSAGRVVGTVTANAGTYTARLTITDKSGATGQSSTFTWTVNQTMTWAAIPTQNSGQNADVNLNVSGYLSRGTAPYTFSATGLPGGLSISSSGVISGRTNTSTAGSTVTVTGRDASGTTASTTFTWNRSNLAMAATDRSIKGGEDFYYYVPATGGTGAYQFAADGDYPDGVRGAVSNDGKGVYFYGNVSRQNAGTYDVWVQVTDANGSIVRSNYKLTVTK